MSRFQNVQCSQCGGDFGPGDHGYSHCRDHRKRNRLSPAAVAAIVDDHAIAQRRMAHLAPFRVVPMPPRERPPADVLTLPDEPVSEELRERCRRLAMSVGEVQVAMTTGRK